MRIYNKEFNTYPICVHFNGGKIKRTQQWQDFLLSYKENIVIKPKELAIVTFNNKVEKGILQNLLELNGAEYYNVASIQRGFCWLDKIIFLNKNIDSIKEEFVVVLDCFDVSVQGNMGLIIDRFSNNEIIFSAELGSQKRVLKKLGGDTFGIFEYEKSKAESKYRHLNAGMLFGKRGAVKDLLKVALDIHETTKIDDDQILYRLARMKLGFPLDYKCEIFKNMAHVDFTNDIIIE